MACFADLSDGGEDWGGFGAPNFIQGGANGCARYALFEMVEVADEKLAHPSFTVGLIVAGEVGDGA